jgi:hypothetical protein
VVATVFARFRLGFLGLGCAFALISAAPAAAATKAVKQQCSAVLAGFAHCDSFVHTVSPHKAKAASAGPPYTPADIQDAYELTAKAALASDQTVAIVDAFDDPNAESDLAAYRSRYGLPPCTTANGCFRKVNQTGGTVMPAPDTGWAGEIALDLDMVSAVCPHCKILLVETNDNSTSNLIAGILEASALGATQISNSWGGNEYSAESYYDTLLNPLSVPITVSSGDDGYGVEYPASSQHVTAVGGSSLTPASNSRGWTETAWDGAGSGCSRYIAKPSWQHDTGCSKRMVADVSAVADPETGVIVYNTYGGGGPWWQVGGTSAAAPIVAASYALLGGEVTGPSYAYDNPRSFNDVQTGSNGSCTYLYFCNSYVGLDGPTGIGTPNLAGTGDGTTAVTNAPPPQPTTTPAPAPAPSAPVQPPPVAPLRSSVSVSSSSRKASTGGTLKVKLTCGDGPSCSGTLTLQTRLRGAALRTLAKKHFSIRSGRSAWVTIRFHGSNWRFVKHKRTLTVFGTALDRDGTTAQSSFRVRAPKPTKHRKHHHR